MRMWSRSVHGLPLHRGARCAAGREKRITACQARRLTRLRDKKGRFATHRAYTARAAMGTVAQGFLATAGPRARPFRHLFEEHIMKTTTKIAAVTLATLSLAAASAVFAHPRHGDGAGMGAGRAPASGRAGPGMGMGGPACVAAWAVPRPPRSSAPACRPEDRAQDHRGAGRRVAGLRCRRAAAGRAAPGAAHADAGPDAGSEGGRRGGPRRPARGDEIAARAALAARSAALKDLYAVLTPEQKALADQRLNGRPWAWHGDARAGALRTAAPEASPPGTGAAIARPRAPGEKPASVTETPPYRMGFRPTGHRGIVNAHPCR